MLCEHLAEDIRVARQRAALVGDDRQRLVDGLSLLSHPQHTYAVAVDSERRRDDGDAVSRFRHREQRVRGAAFKDVVRCEACEAAGCVEVPAHREIRRGLQERMRREAGDVNLPLAAQPHLRMACRQHFHRRERMAREALIVWVDRPRDCLHQVDLAAFEHCERFHPGRRIHEPDLHARKARSVVPQELREDCFNQVG